MRLQTNRQTERAFLRKRRSKAAGGCFSVKKNGAKRTLLRRGGEGEIRTLAPVIPTYSLSRGAPSAYLGTSPNRNYILSYLNAKNILRLRIPFKSFCFFVQPFYLCFKRVGGEGGIKYCFAILPCSATESFAFDTRLRTCFAKNDYQSFS